MNRPLKDGGEHAPSRFPEVLTPDDLARLLQTSRKKVFELARRGEIPGTRQLSPKILRFSRDAVLAWLRTEQGCASRGDSHGT
jgi:excisionase family DNA binding protein